MYFRIGEIWGILAISWLTQAVLNLNIMCVLATIAAFFLLIVIGCFGVESLIYQAFSMTWEAGTLH